MQVKVFEAKDMASGLKMVKEALGPDALILSTRTIRNGTFGVMGKPMMEITAAVDNTWQEPVERPVNDRRSGLPPSRPQRSEPQRDISYEEIWAQNKPAASAAPYQQQQPAANREIQNELAELRNIVKGLSSRISFATRATAASSPNPASTHIVRRSSASGNDSKSCSCLLATRRFRM